MTVSQEVTNKGLFIDMLISSAKTVFRYTIEIPSAEANLRPVVCPTESSENQGTELSKIKKQRSAIGECNLST